MRSVSIAAKGKAPKMIAGMGYATLDRIYTPTHKRPIEALGGSCANVLVSLAMLGHRVAPILNLGSDDTGSFLLKEMERAGCVTQFVFREPNEESPIVVEYLDIELARHAFSSTCPETHRKLPGYRPVAESNADRAKAAIRAASIFYVDRLSDTTLLAMKEASVAGALVLFEPNSLKDWSLFRRALDFVDILKVSEDTRAEMDAQSFVAPRYFISTRGSDGLILETNARTVTLPSITAPRLVDTCGAGDMVTTGLIHWLMNFGATRRSIRMDDVYSGLVMGQRLAALNCAFAGARGAFHAFGGATIRNVLMLRSERSLNVVSVEPFAGYKR